MKFGGGFYCGQLHGLFAQRSGRLVGNQFVWLIRHRNPNSNDASVPLCDWTGQKREMRPEKLETAAQVINGFYMAMRQQYVVPGR